MKKMSRVLSVLFIATLGLTSCSIGSLPYDERYQNIDKVLTDIDYQNIGTIVHEEIDNGDGVFAPSYKKIYYKEGIVFNKIFSKLRHAPDNVNENCSEIQWHPKDTKDQSQVNCTYYGNSINLGRSTNKDGYGSVTRIMITDGLSGRG